MAAKGAIFPVFDLTRPGVRNPDLPHSYNLGAELRISSHSLTIYDLHIKIKKLKFKFKLKCLGKYFQEYKR